MKKSIIFIFLTLSFFCITGCGKKQFKEKGEEEQINDSSYETFEPTIIDIHSNTRPYAVVINNSLPAIKVQTGLSDAYLIYEFPVEGGISRSLALYKDKMTAKIGTVRSARHNFLDYVLENDAIFVHYGWSYHAENQIPELGIDNINGLYDSPFWRENPEKLASEHTAYTSLEKCEQLAKKKKYRLETDKKIPFQYASQEIFLSSDSVVAKEVQIPYSNSYQVKFVYDDMEKKYTRYVNGKEHQDYFTKDVFTAKNILVVKIDYAFTSDGYYLELANLGKGTGYYITNGNAKEITWEKNRRNSQTVYQYLDGSSLELNDGNTYVMFQSKAQKLSFK